jgi:hypothetical protein
MIYLERFADPIGRRVIPGAASVGSSSSQPPMKHSIADLEIPGVASQRTIERRSVFDSNPFLCDGILTEDRPYNLTYPLICAAMVTVLRFLRRPSVLRDPPVMRANRLLQREPEGGEICCEPLDFAAQCHKICR